MDLKRIFIKDACPTKIGGQAVISGIMMRGDQRTATALRMPDDSLEICIEENKPLTKVAKVPLLRGVFVFVATLVMGTKILMHAADMLERWDREHPDFVKDVESESDRAQDQRDRDQEKGDDTKEDSGTQDNSETEAGGIASNGDAKSIGDAAADSVAKGDADTEESAKVGFIERKFGAEKAWNFAIVLSVVFALFFTIVIFIIMPTVVVSLLKHWTENEVVLNLVEGVLRILLFILYVLLISRLEDIKDVFRYHGAEHKTIHCYENGLELTPANARQFYTLHPRCGTSFLMFVLVISLILFSLLGWPNLLWRILSRVLLLPVIAGISYELLKWAGRSDSGVVKVLSIPGLALQKLTTKEPTDKHLEVAICAMKAVLNNQGAPGEGSCDLDGRILQYRQPEQKEISDCEKEE